MFGLVNTIYNACANMVARTYIAYLDGMEARVEVAPLNNPPAVNALNQVITTVQTIFNTILGLLAIGGIVLAVWIGFRLASAEDEGKRKEAKKQLLWAIVAIFGIAVLILVFNLLIGMLRTGGALNNNPGGLPPVVV